VTNQIDLLDDGILREDRVADPYPYLKGLQDNDPVYWNETLRAWFLTKYEDIFQALRDPRFSSDRVRPVYEQRLSEEQRNARKPTYDVLLNWMVFMDPPEHTRLRKLVMPAFTPNAIAAMRPRVQEIVNEAIAEVKERKDFDFIHDFAYPVPAIIIAELIGVPAEDRDLFKHWSDEILVLVFGAAGNADRRERAQQALVELTDYLRDLIHKLRDNPGDNIISNLLQVHDVEGEAPLTEQELVATLALLVFGGHETTTNLIANGARVLMQHPDQWQKLRDNPELARSATEEILRFDGPSKMEARVMLEDVELRGKTLRKGDSVYFSQGAANHDPDVFSDPETFDIERTPNRHIGFGHGLHHCLGNFLARLEGEIAFNAIVQNLDGLRPAEGRPEVWHPTLMSRGMISFPVQRDVS
jgi:cytochrome P450